MLSLLQRLGAINFNHVPASLHHADPLNTPVGQQQPVISFKKAAYGTSLLTEIECPANSEGEMQASFCFAAARILSILSEEAFPSKFSSDKAVEMYIRCAAPLPVTMIV